MPQFHLNPATSVAAPCVLGTLCSIPSSHHFPSLEEAVAFHEELLRGAALLEGPQVSARLKEALRTAAAGGFAMASEEYPLHLPGQVALLAVPEVLEYLSNKLAVSNREKAKERYARALAWVAHQEAEKLRETPQRWFHRELERHLRTNSARARVQAALTEELPPASELVKVAGELWVYQGSYLNAAAKRALFSEPLTLGGYTQGKEGHATTYSNCDVVASMKTRFEDLPEGALTFDIETDTEFGFGLRPTHSQITELVVSSRETSWVFSGNERFILEAFADLLNSQEAPVTLVGWNSQGFDNIFLQTRAELHEIATWRGELSPAKNFTNFEPVGPTPCSQALTWVTPGGLRLTDRDVFQEKVALDQARGERYTRGLKPFVESLGCEPVKVDRQRLHELSEEERVRYVLSDGIATLRALTQVDILHQEAALQAQGATSLVRAS